MKRLFILDRLKIPKNIKSEKLLGVRGEGNDIKKTPSNFEDVFLIARI